ncbi:RagB/SusD family nutrient uptake outer membrane protein [Flavobacterium sp. UBA7663]|uniref:RagB/SusD family nutrient uptake outer membrane protein n=1 Tax=Flavobacterium sp. UBA7663 TaxID=1946557 RepID=UPI0025BBB1A1|nr:RagB/SusD family nutrient uptake outer membrane protein [Flavobacterium sp. UBA7663]
MKKIKKMLFFSLIVIFTASCDDAIEIVQDGEINNETSFKTVANLRSYLNGDIYGRVDIGNEIAFTSIFTDEVGVGPSNGGQALELHRYFFNANDGYAEAIWLNNYTIINRVNRLIEVSNLVVTTNPTDEAEKQSILAEARTLRALSYLKLMTYYSEDMSDDSALGVLLLDFVPTIDTKLPRVANSQIYNLMEGDLLFAENNLLPSSVNYKYVTANLVNAIRARMYLYRKDYVLAKQYAQAVITGSGLSLSNTAQYTQMWRDLAQGEVIFAASRPSAGAWSNVASNFFFNTTTATGGAFLDMGRNLFNELGSVSGDIRRTVFVDGTSTIDATYLTNPNYINSDVLVIDKYPGKASQPLRNDLKLFRLSEMYFILAECEVGGATPNLVQAATYIQAVRTARNTVAQPLPVYGTPQAAWADILLERRKELCFEGHRYIDIKRLGALANASIDRNITDDIINSTPLTLPVTDYRFTFPIPQSEIAGNLQLQQQQNTGY